MALIKDVKLTKEKVQKKYNKFLRNFGLTEERFNEQLYLVYSNLDKSNCILVIPSMLLKNADILKRHEHNDGIYRINNEDFVAIFHHHPHFAIKQIEGNNLVGDLVFKLKDNSAKAKEVHVLVSLIRDTHTNQYKSSYQCMAYNNATNLEPFTIYKNPDAFYMAMDLLKPEETLNS